MTPTELEELCASMERNGTQWGMIAAREIRALQARVDELEEEVDNLYMEMREGDWNE